MNMRKRILGAATALMLALFAPLPQISFVAGGVTAPAGEVVAPAGEVTAPVVSMAAPAVEAQAASAAFPTVSGKWKKTSKGMTFVQKNGVAVKGKMVTIKGKVYSFSASGYRQTGWVSYKGKWYYMDAGGAAKKGWTEVKKKWYYLDPKTYAMHTGWLALNRERAFYLNKKGVMLTGPQTINGKAYVFTSEGVLKEGRVRIKGRTYGSAGFSKQKKNKEGGKWNKVEDRWVYMKKDGSFAKNEKLKILGQYYLFDSQGYMVTGWKKVNGKWYYAGSDGALAVNCWKKIDHEEYYFYKDGHMAANTTVDGAKILASGAKYRKKPAIGDSIDEKAQGYESSTDYLILVNKSLHKVGIYKGEKGYWNNIRKVLCGDGKPSTPTIEGSFVVGLKMRYFDSGAARCWYATQFCGNFLFHSVLYYQTQAPTYVMDGRVGAGVSHGCVRLQLDDCLWIYNNIPRGTRVIVYR